MNHRTPHGREVCAAGDSRVVVVQREHNRSAFNGYHYTPSYYSELYCQACGKLWRSRGKYIVRLPDGKIEHPEGTQ